MKTLNLIFFGAVLTLGVASHGAEVTPETKPLVCENSANSTGWLVTVATDETTATLQRKSPTGPLDVQFGSLKCEPIHEQRRGFDMIEPFLRCYSPGVADAGYEVTLKAGGFVYQVLASIEEQSFFGTNSVEVGLRCHPLE